MSNEQIKSELKSLGDNINEVLSSTEALKGEAFAKAVSVNFECAQLIELIGRLVILAKEADEEMAAAAFEAAKNILASIACKATEELEEDQLEEAMKMAYTLYQRRNDTIKRIQGMTDDDE